MRTHDLAIYTRYLILTLRRARVGVSLVAVNDKMEPMCMHILYFIDRVDGCRMYILFCILK